MNNGETPDLGAVRRAREGAGLPAEPAEMPLAGALGQSFNPQPFGYVILKGHTSVGPCLYLIFETSVGRFAVAVDRTEAEGMARKLLAESSGLVVPPSG